MRNNTSSLILLFITMIAGTSCNQDKYNFLYNSYTGTSHPAERINKDNSTEKIPSAEILVRITAKNIYMNDEGTRYKITGDTGRYISIEAYFGKKLQKFNYNKDSGILVLLGKNESENLILMTEEMIMKSKLNSFARFSLTSDINHLSSGQKEMLKILFRVADIMDQIYWEESYGNKFELMSTTQDSLLKKLFSINYGPWERMNNNKPFLSIYGEKPAGANFYPKNITKEEFEALDDSAKNSQYSILRRNENGQLYSIPYHEFFREQLKEASELLRKAAGFAEDKDFMNYLLKRAAAFETDNYYESDVAWMMMKNNPIDFVVGPIENYEDALFNYKSAHEAYILIKDRDWSEKLARIAKLIPVLQKGLPVPALYKKEIPSDNSDLNVYDAVYYAGDCNSGSKTIAINLPNDPEVRKTYGSRKLQLKNTIRAKFENIMIPIGNILISNDQRQYIDFDAFFENIMYHEVAHGLGVDYTINGKGMVREALKECYSAIEEWKADIMGLYIITKLTEMNEMGDKNLMTNYVTFMAGTFRSVRFGAASAHGISNMIRFNYFQRANAFARDEISGSYRIDFEKMKENVISQVQEIITIEATGDYEKARKIISENGSIQRLLQLDLNRLNSVNIPVDIVFDQGPGKLGL